MLTEHNLMKMLTLIAVGDTDRVTKVPAASYCTAAEAELRRL